jgi:hypothetical protein
MVLDLKIGDVIKLKKIHPCGGYEWEVTRLGADIGIRCRKCRRYILLTRNVLERRIKELVSRGPG